MKPATTYIRGDSRKLVFYAGDDVHVGPVRDLLNQIRPNDLIVVNDSATAPSMLQVKDEKNRQLEIRLVKGLRDYQAIVFENGSWKAPTEERQKIEHVDRLNLNIGDENHNLRALKSGGFTLTANNAKPVRSNLLEYALRNGSMVQYSYMETEVPVWANQTIFASRPWSSEAPSAAFSLNWQLVFAIIAKGASFVAISHGAGLSSIGNETDDLRLPLPEVSHVSLQTLAKIEQTKRSGGRIIAIGTSVVRAVEAAWTRLQEKKHDEHPFLNSLTISDSRQINVFDGILSGLHDSGESHFKLLSSFSSSENIQKMLKKAHDAGCLTHEFGDFMLLFSVQKDSA